MRCKKRARYVDWSLHIVFCDVSQAEAIAMITPEGEAWVIAAGRTPKDANKITEHM